MPITVAAGVLCLAACGTTSVPSATGSASPHVTASPVSCRQQYLAWRNGPALPEGKKLVAMLRKVSAAGAVMDIPQIDEALRKGGEAAASAGRYPAPRCADPAGYWRQLLARVHAAGDDAGAGGSGLSSLILAEVPLKSVPQIQRELSAEIERTTGIKGA